MTFDVVIIVHNCIVGIPPEWHIIDYIRGQIVSVSGKGGGGGVGKRILEGKEEQWWRKGRNRNEGKRVVGRAERLKTGISMGVISSCGG